MAHEIDTSTGVAAVFTVGEPPWHRLGINVQDAQTSEQAITLAHLDWEVDLWPVQASSADRIITCKRYRATVRQDTHQVLGIVGTDYEPFQNQKAFEFMDAIVGEKLAMFESAGCLRHGRVVWMLVRIPKDLHVLPEDDIHPYLLLTNSHDGSMAVRMLPTTVRVVCMNTLNLALRQGSEGQGSGWSIRHCSSLHERVEEARRALGLVSQRLDRFSIEVKLLCDRQLTGRQLNGHFGDLLPIGDTERQKANRDSDLAEFHANFENKTNTLSGIRGSAWAAYNAVSEWADHQKSFRGADSILRQQRRLDSIWFGSSNELKQHAWAGAGTGHDQLITHYARRKGVEWHT